MSGVDAFLLFCHVRPLLSAGYDNRPIKKGRIQEGAGWRQLDDFGSYMNT